MHILSRLNGPGFHGFVTGKEYETISIRTTGSKSDLQTYKINPDGSFYVILKPGVYDITFNGAKTRQFNALTINSKIEVKL